LAVSAKPRCGEANKNSDKIREQPGVRWFGVLECRDIWINGIMDDWKIENCDLGL